MASLQASKRCTQCGLTKPIEEFGRHAREKDGLRRHCKPCNASFAKRWSDAHLDQKRATSAAWSKKNRERKLAADRARAATHRDEASARTRAWVAANPERKKLADRQYHTANRDRISRQAAANYAADSERYRALAIASYRANKEKRRPAQQAAKQRRRARLRSVENTLTKRDIEEAIEISCGLCAYCLRPCEKLTVEHVIPISKGGANAAHNIVMACRFCNYSKNDRGILYMIGRCASASR